MAPKTAATEAPVTPTLVAEDVDEMPAGTRTRTRQATAFDGWVRESKASGKAKAVTVPADKVKAVVSTIRGAASSQGLGVQIRTVDQGHGNVKVYFLGKSKRAYNKNAL